MLADIFSKGLCDASLSIDEISGNTSGQARASGLIFVMCASLAARISRITFLTKPVVHGEYKMVNWW